MPSAHKQQHTTSSKSCARASVQLTHWTLEKVTVSISHSQNYKLQWLISGLSLWNSRECHGTSLMMSISVQVMAWCSQAPSHYLSQCWPRSMMPYSVTSPQWVNTETISYHQILQNLQSFRFLFRVVQSFQNLTGASAALLRYMYYHFENKSYFFKTLQDLVVILTAQWTEPQSPYAAPKQVPKACISNHIPQNPVECDK